MVSNTSSVKELPYIFDLLYDIKTIEDIQDIMQGNPTRCTCSKKELIELAQEIDYEL